jgi:hypothetical protein
MRHKEIKQFFQVAIELLNDRNGILAQFEFKSISLALEPFHGHL